jgi:hypothetical protein
VSDGQTVAPLRIVRGDPTSEEVAVLAALVAARGGGGGDTAPGSARERRGGWNDPARQHGRTMLPGPNGWRAAAR